MIGVNAQDLERLVAEHQRMLCCLIDTLRRAAGEAAFAHELTDVNIVFGKLEEVLEELLPNGFQDRVDSTG